MSAIRNYLVEIIGVAFAVNVALVMAICIVYIKDKENSDGMMCINGMMYTKVMGNLLIYPRPDEPMTCSIYSYIQKHRDKK